MKKWKQSDLNNLPLSLREKNAHVLGPSSKKSKLPKPKKIHEQLLWMKLIFAAKGIEYIEEYKFCKTRKFRFDLFIPSLNAGWEYEGIASRKSRHTTMKGYTGDAAKYNLAQSLGFHVYRYTILNYKDFETDLEKLLK